MTPPDTGAITERPSGPPAIAEPRARSLVRALSLATAGSVAYGGWAGFANSDHGARAAWLAGLTQAAMSFVTTFLLTLLGDWILRRCARVWTQLAAAVLVTPAVVAVVLASVHLAARTPNVRLTILPSVVGGTVFCVAYVAARRTRLGLHKLRYRGDVSR